MDKLVSDLNKIFEKYKVSPEDVKTVQDDFAEIEGGGAIMSDDGADGNNEFVPPDENGQGENYG